MIYETLEPQKFKESNFLARGYDHDKDHVKDLPMYVDHESGQRISVWKCKSIRARLQFLFTGRLNLVELCAGRAAVYPRAITIGSPFK